MEGEGNMGRARVLFLFRELKAPGVGEVPVIKSAELVVFSVLTVLVRTKHICV